MQNEEIYTHSIENVYVYANQFFASQIFGPFGNIIFCVHNHSKKKKKKRGRAKKGKRQ